MASIIIPGKWNTQPQYPVELAKSSLTWNIEHCLVPRGLTFADLITGTVMTPSSAGTNSAIVASNNGGYSRPSAATAVQVTTASDQGFVFPSNSTRVDQITGTDRYTFLHFGGTNITAAQVTTLFGVIDPLVTGAGIVLGYDDNAAVGAGKIRLSGSYALSSTNQLLPNPIRQKLNFCGVAYQGGSDLRFYHSGRTTVQSNSTSIGSASVNRRLFLGNPGGGSGLISKGAFATYALVAKGVMPDAQWLEIYNNPWQIFRKRPQILYFDVGGGGATQDLTPSLYTNSSTFHAPIVSAGSVTLTPALFSNTQTFHAATVSQSGAAQDLTPSLYANAQVFHQPTVSAVAVTLAPALVVNSQTFHQPALSVGAVTLLPSLVSNSQTFYAASVSIEGGPQYLVPDLVANSQTFHAATISTGAVTLTPALFANAQTFYSATVSQAGLTLEPALFVNTHQFFTAIVTTGGVTLTPGLFTNSATFYVAAVSGGIQTTLGAARSSGRQIQTAARNNIQTNRR